MDKASKIKNRVKNVNLIILSCILVLLIMLISAINRSGLADIHVGSYLMPVSPLSGVITVFMLLVSLQMLNTDNKKGFAAAVILNAVQLISVSRAVFIKGNMQSIAGIATMCGGLGLLYMQHRHLIKMEQDEERLRRLSVTDPLTGLNNRRSIMEHVNSRIADNVPFSVIFIDLDNFKYINDTMGHACGDIVLCEASRRWNELSGDDVYIGRMSGDEFAMIVTGRSDEEVIEFAKHILSVLSEKIYTGKCDYYATGSAGIAAYPRDGGDCESLFRFSDTAMYKAKSRGKNQVCSFDSNMLSEIKNELSIENEIRGALKYNRFYLVFQPQFETENKRLRGFETLLRLKDSEGQPIPPSVFIPIAEKSGLILDIDRWVLRHAMLSFSESIADGADFVLSVNVSARHVTEKGFADEVSQIMDETGFPPEMLEIEVTESCFISSVDDAVAALLEIKALGVKIALDDFGTGYASLSYLQRLPIDLLKVDKSFIDDMTDRDDGGNFVKAIISIGHMFNCKVISEGVELDSQLQILRELKCDYIQGYIWGKPQPQNDAARLIP
ncbi:MAG: bifunctional diguanylate cyclase/phosphodiesterase [Oscillospiraceae bacterium]|nr:bifunctional diguanylate cyclase/phosphodiesterase [Oscillospiraceae bacterium]